jgi:hypothetical protein
LIVAGLSCRSRPVQLLGVEGEEISDHQVHGEGRLLRHDSVSEGPELSGTGDLDVSHPAGAEPHEPLDEGRGQPGATVSVGFGGVRRGYAEDGLPALDGRGVDAPVDVCRGAGAVSAGRFSGATSTACSGSGP